MARYTPSNKGGDLAPINVELEKIKEAIDDTLSRKGDTPNAMQAPLDMNGQRILNLPEPKTSNEPARLKDIQAEAELPVQDSNAGKYLQTNGSAATWQQIQATDVQDKSSRTVQDTVTKVDALTAATVAEAKALAVPVGTVVETQGYYSSGDGGANRYVVVAGGTGTDTGVVGSLYIDMANGSQLLEIKGSNLNTLPSVSSLREYEGRYDGDVVEVVSYYDGWAAVNQQPKGGGIFVWNGSSTVVEDGGVTIAVTGVTTGRWLRKLDNFVTPQMFGSVGDDTTDYRTNLLSFFAFCDATKTPFLISGSHRFSGTITIPDGVKGKYINGNLQPLSGGFLVDNSDSISELSGDDFGAAAKSLTRGVNVKLSTPITGSGFDEQASTYAFNSCVVEDDRVDAVNDTTGGTKVDNFRSLHLFGGAGARGGRHSGDFVLIQNAETESDNTDRNYVGVVGQVVTSTGDGGTGGNGKGAYFGGNMYAANTGGQYLTNLTSCEFNTVTTEQNGNGVHIHYGIQIVSSHKERGYTRDAAVGISNKSASATTWRDGIRFGNSNGAHPLGADSRVLFVEEQGGVRVGISMPKCSESILKSGGVDLKDNGLSVTTPNYVFDIGKTDSSGSVRFDFNTSGVTTDYDSRLLFSSGSSTTGNGVATISSGIIALSSSTEISMGSTIRPVVDNAYDYGRPDRRGRTAYFGTGSINTSDEREKTELLDYDAAEKSAALEIKQHIKKFKFIDAVNSKGDKARIHFGVGAQAVKSILGKHGLNPFDYGFLCYDEWGELPEIKETIEKDGVKSEVVTQEYRAAGNRYGIRYDELAMFILGSL